VLRTDERSGHAQAFLDEQQPRLEHFAVISVGNDGGGNDG
jgi:hypothetical protein